MRSTVPQLSAIAGMLLVARTASAELPALDVRRPSPSTTLPTSGGFELAMGALLIRPQLNDEWFAAQGTPVDGTRRESLRARGRQLGIAAPRLAGGELSLFYTRRFFAVGAMGFFARNLGGADGAARSDDGASFAVNPSDLRAFGGGLDIAGAVPLGPVSIRPGVVFGMRAFEVPLSGFQARRCRRRAGVYPCAEEATTNVQLFLEPRLRVELTPPRSAISFGGYVGLGLAGGVAPTAGLFVSVTMTPR